LADDASLAAAVHGKDRKATAEFVNRYSDRIYAYVRSRLAPRYEHVDDVVQEVFLSAWENLSRYRAEGSLQAWVMAIAQHKVEDYYRQRLRMAESIEDADLDVISTRAAAVHHVVEQYLLQKKIRRIFASLPERYRLALIWRYWDKASAREMAEKTGKTEKAIERLLARARAEFRERWNRDRSSR